MAYLIYPAAAIAGFIVLAFGSILVIGQVAGAMPYEDGLPIVLAAGVVGAVLAVNIVRRLRKRA